MKTTRFQIGLIIFMVMLLLSTVYVVKQHSHHEYNSFFDSINAQWDIDSEEWIICEIPTPEQQMRIEFLIRKCHPFLAEFERKIVLLRSNLVPVDIPIGADTGGQTQLKVFLYFSADKRYLKLCDADDIWWAIDIGDEKVKVVSNLFSEVNAIGFVSADKNILSIEHQENINFFNKINWRYIGLINYDGDSNNEQTLVFEPNEKI